MAANKTDILNNENEWMSNNVNAQNRDEFWAQFQKNHEEMFNFSVVSSLPIEEQKELNAWIGGAI